MVWAMLIAFYFVCLSTEDYDRVTSSSESDVGNEEEEKEQNGKF